MQWAGDEQTPRRMQTLRGDAFGYSLYLLLKYRFCLWSFESVLLHQFTQLAVGNVGLVGLIIDGDKCNVGTVAFDKHSVGDDPRATILALSFRGDGETHLAKMLAQRRP